MKVEFSPPDRKLSKYKNPSFSDIFITIIRVSLTKSISIKCQVYNIWLEV